MKGCGFASIGDLREFVEIQAEVKTADGMGGFTVTGWAKAANSPTRAKVTAAPGSERWNFMRQGSGNTFKMVTRYFEGATAAQRVVWRGGQYAVLGVVDPDGRRKWLDWRLSDGAAP
jgi:SPP1 family predicted phage head-tail adaptor